MTKNRQDSITPGTETNSVAAPYDDGPGGPESSGDAKASRDPSKPRRRHGVYDNRVEVSPSSARGADGSLQ